MSLKIFIDSFDISVELHHLSRCISISATTQLICTDICVHVHVNETKVEGDMLFHLLLLVLMNVSGICLDSCPARTRLTGPPACGLKAQHWGNLAGGKGNEANPPPMSLTLIHTAMTFTLMHAGLHTHTHAHVHTVCTSGVAWL